ncbi:hypothetical protein GZ77_21870 [Endozoicomonas montiporae]|uniref:Secondary thiamine-phosphate synthase n=2 Tax=Endozoicomonas montiporae TaxID=1027273 RepID=A0A081N3N0_9GAMM|nr:secondary thiamine-phosphate synthase enzyme YjbQ [Endozoicomonas montiporae]AMO58372.1 hypothetical protein EZMO1_4457 [Endozoicomonas montiporae CL-33]KEQ13053.1 hypothetical protein GZ77_21870 [Endozoicomonas montiporae]
MDWYQTQLKLVPRERGFHLITHEIEQQLPELERYRVGLCHLLLQHTSASLTLNENADPDVRADMESFCCHEIPESADYYRHTLEGPDDMPAHIKSSLFGVSLSIPVSNGRFALGTWQGIWLGEHRTHYADEGRQRIVIATLQGQLYK